MCSNGSPEEGIALANLFLDKGLITYLQGQKVAREDSQAVASKEITKAPLAVVVNRGTAGAAEVAAAALLDSKRADVVGEHTYGDAAIRKPVPMEDGSAVIFRSPNIIRRPGKAIQDTGVTPNVARSRCRCDAERRSWTTIAFRIPPTLRPRPVPIMRKSLTTVEKTSK